jgi:hypothetical protein
MCSGVQYENGFIVLLSPAEYFSRSNITTELAAKGLALGANALVFYETREQWAAHNPDTLHWTPAHSRTDPLGGEYVARISATTSTADGARIVRGFTATSLKGAGIRAYEYASSEMTEYCRLQLEALFWLCKDSHSVVISNGMTDQNASTRRTAILADCEERGLLDMQRLAQARILNSHTKTVCPLCLEELSSQGFFNRMAQAEGRLVLDLTITELNLFHIVELRYGANNHMPYNLGWGHHHCNVVVKDSGIRRTLEWMRAVLDRNIEGGHL